MLKSLILNKCLDETRIFDNIFVFVRRGNINVLKAYMKKAEDSYRCGFNRLYAEAVSGKIEGRINKFSVLKKPHTNQGICPLHVACIQPDVSILRKLYAVNPEYSASDFSQRKLVHYAAANISEDCMQFLISKNIPSNDKDQRGTTPLMIACELGRISTVLLLIDESKKQIETLDEEDEDYNIMMQSADFVNTRGPGRKTALHFAALGGHMNCVKALIEKGGANVNEPDTNSMTPLMIACERGNLDIV